MAIPSMVQREPGVLDAVNNPAALMAPHFADHVTGALAVNCNVPPSGTVPDTGVITMGETMLTAVLAVCVPLVAVAVTVQDVLG